MALQIDVTIGIKGAYAVLEDYIQYCKIIKKLNLRLFGAT